MKANKVRATLGTFLGLALLFCSGASFAALTATEIQKLVGSEVLPTDLFGDEVTLEGDTILVGAPKSDEYGEDSGAAYVFTRDPATGVWTEEASLTPLDTSPSPRLYLFGRSVALFGDTALVGSELPRAAYVFIRDALSGIWIQEAKLSTTDDDYTFSQSVALSDDTALIGAPAADMDTRFGAAYVGLDHNSARPRLCRHRRQTGRLWGARSSAPSGW